jgi:hypothetical protein
MTTHKFSFAKAGQLQAQFHQANADLRAATRRQRDLAAQLEAELYLARLFGQGSGVRPQ